MTCKKMIQKEMSKPDNEKPFMLINVPDSFRSEPPIKQLEARLINAKGKLIGFGKAEAHKEIIYYYFSM